MDTLLSLRVFREVVDNASFVGAAKRLGLSTAMASKHVAHLERQLGARLLNRTSRHLSLTEAGTLYLAQCREALDSLQAGEAAIGKDQEAPRGVLKVTAPVWCATRHFADVLAAYRQAHPEVMVDIRLENRRVDLVEEGYDLALRVSRDPAATLIVRPLCSLQFHLVAAPTYLKRAGAPKNPADIERTAAEAWRTLRSSTGCKTQARCCVGLCRCDQISNRSRLGQFIYYASYFLDRIDQFRDTLYST